MPSDAEVVEVLARAITDARGQDPKAYVGRMTILESNLPDARRLAAALRSAGYAVVLADMQRDAQRMAMALLDWTPDLNVQTEAEARAAEEEILAIARRFALTKDPTNAQ